MRTFLQCPVSAIALAALCLCSASAQAGAIVVNSHFLQADTSVSAEQERRVDAVDGVRFDDSVLSQGLGSQGATGQARASQNVLYAEQGGASGFVESSVNLDSGISGSAQSLLFVAFDVTGLSNFLLDGSTLTDGNAFAGRRLRLRLDVAAGDDIEIFDLDFSSAAFSLAGTLDPGRYLFSVSTETASIDPGDSGRSRIDFDFRFDAVAGGNHVPEPGSLGLAAAALGLMAGLRRQPRRKGTLTGPSAGLAMP